MRNGSIRIYALGICFVSIICVAIASGFALYNLVTLIAPGFTIDARRIAFLQSNEDFVNSPYAFVPDPSLPMPALGIRGIPPGLSAGRGFLSAEALAAAGMTAPKNRFAGMSQQEITTQRLDSLAKEMEAHRVQARAPLIKQLLIILIATALFYPHWRLARRLES